MRRAALLILLFCGLPGLRAAQIGIYQHGTVVRMHMGDCVPGGHRGFMVTMGGPPSMGQESCPEYTLVSNDVVYVVVGKSSNQLIPLAETIDFRLHKNEIAVRIDDAKHETKFMIKEMVMRSDWDHLQQHVNDKLRASDDYEGVIKTRDK